MQVHDGEVGALVPVDHGVGVEPHDEVAAELAAFLQEVEVTNVEQVEGSGNIDNLLAGLGAFAVGKLEGDSRFSVIT